MSDEYKAKVIELAKYYYNCGYSKFDAIRKAEANLRLLEMMPYLSSI